MQLWKQRGNYCGKHIKNMDYLTLIKDLFQGLGSIGVLVVVFAFWKMGFFDGKKNGTSQESINQNFRNDIKELYSHSDVANKEMAEVKTSLAVIDSRLGRIEEDIKSLLNK